MDKATKIALAIIGIAILGYISSFLIAPSSSWTGSLWAFKFTLADSVLYTLLYIGAAILLLFGASAYKAALRSAYIRITIGVILVGGGLAQVVALDIFGLLQTPWVQYGGVMLPFVAAGLAIYSGVRSMAKLVDINSILMKPWFVILALVVVMVGAAIVPHGASSLPNQYFAAFNAISAWDLVLYAISLGIVLKIKGHSGTFYTRPMAWLALGLFGSVIVTLVVLLMTLVTGKEAQGYFLDALVIIGGLVYVKAGQSFAKTKEL